MIISGSYALKYYYPEFRENKDIDFITNDSGAKNYMKFLPNYKFNENTKWGYNYISNLSKPVEFELIEKHESSRMLWDLYSAGGIIPPAGILMMKLSHRYLKNSPHFLKTMRDIQFLRSKGIELNSQLKEIFKIREKETYNYAHPKLSRNKIDFFENNQEGYKKQDYLVYDHDSIHEAIKLLDKPAYDYIKISSEDVLCSKDKFNSQPEHIKLMTVYEETAVLALERILIPSNFKYNYMKAFLIALEKVCTSISSGWWREYAWEHYDATVKFWYNIGTDKYVKDFNEAKTMNKLSLWKQN